MKKHPCQYIESLPDDAVAIPGFPNAFAAPRGEIFTTHGRAKRRRFGSNSVGYPICGLKRDDGKYQFMMVHRIIAKLFVPGDQSLTVNHIDMDKENCAASNLEWVTFSENHKKGHKLKPEWRVKVGRSKSRPIVAINPNTGERHEFPSGKAAGIWCGDSNRAANISRVLGTGKLSMGFRWERLDKTAEGAQKVGA